MKAHLFCIECLTNLHVGSGESNYNIIDNEVERDPVLKNVPVIHASGVKGALRAHCRNGKPADKEKPWIKEVFGKPSTKEESGGGGTYKFFTANLLVRPLRVSGGDLGASYVLTTTEEIVKKLESLTSGLGETLEIPTDACGKVSAEGESLDCFKPENAALFGEEEVAIAKSFESFDLPSLARNCLDEKGISQNLWYEEFVPYTSRFYFFVLAPEGDKNFDAFKAALEGSAVQFGGNASVGYGYCRVKEVALP